MWEWYTTKPYVDSGEVRFIGSVPTPWPSWTIAASTNTALAEGDARGAVLAEFLSRLQQSIHEFANPETRASGKAKQFIVNHHGYKEEDVESWLNTVRWADEQTPNPRVSSCLRRVRIRTRAPSRLVRSNTHWNCSKRRACSRLVSTQPSLSTLPRV